MSQKINILMVCFSMDFEHTRYNDKIYCDLYGFSFTVVKINVLVFCVMTSCCSLVAGCDVLPPSLLFCKLGPTLECTARYLNLEYHKI